MLAAVAADTPPIAVDFSVDTAWRGEIIALPPGFAPDMSIKGVEDIRFAPGMFKADQADFFSYLFVITSSTGQRLDEAFVQKELLAYYRGLARAVSKGAIDPAPFTLTLENISATRYCCRYCALRFGTSPRFWRPHPS